ncbi:MAG: hypothetical protein IKN65_00035 [Clostridia bacterium]|nr:hypothetical protein [Bacilli bacterium]MBR3672671.1 hypothetical protein [Clostridia bacterium]MBR4671598.1 hypothetical protein [Bacilli bacterium]
MNNNKSDLWNIISLLKGIIIAAFVTIVLIVAAFVTYLILGNTISTVDATGVYNLVDSENGQVIATDLTSEDIEKIMTVLGDK